MVHIAEQVVSRRKALQYSGGAAVAALTSMARVGSTLAAPVARRPVYSLDPESCVLGRSGNQDCGACKACRGHAQKLFRSAELANTRRAHRYCNCAIKATQVATSDFVGFFGPPGGPLGRDEFDPRRDTSFNSAGRK